MNRIFICLALAFATFHASPARADDPAPTKEQLDAAKKAFEEGNRLFKARKYPEAIEKLKESYRLSKNALLLYNIGHAHDQAKQLDKALFYYQKFLSLAPANAPMRPKVVKRVAVLDKQKVAADLSEEEAPPPPPEQPPPPPPPVETKPAAELRHELIFSAPPGKPVHITASIDGTGLIVTLFYRGWGDDKFTAEVMKPHDAQLVAKIPGAKMQGTSIQYYIEVKDAAGTLVTRSGKSTVPNLVNIETDAKPQYIEALIEPGDIVAPRKIDPELGRPQVGGEVPEETDTGRSTATAKWISTGVAGGLLGTTIVMYMLAKNQHDKLVADTVSCGAPPCRQFDEEFGQKNEELGLRYNTLYKVGIGATVVGAGLAGFFWYRDFKAKKDAQGLAVAPAVGDFMGAIATGRF